MERLDLLDPTHAGDPAFDPRSPQARRVLAAATAPRPASRPPRRRAPRLALGGLAAAVLAAAVVVGTTTTGAPDARAALLQAAEKTGAADSGRLLWTSSMTAPAEFDLSTRSRVEMRFDGENVDMTESGRVEERGKVTETRSWFRLIDGRGYMRNATGPGTGWVYSDGMEVNGMLMVSQQADNPALVKLVRSGADVTAEDGPSGSTVYRTTTTVGAYRDAAPISAGHSNSQEPMHLEVTVGADGFIRRVHTRDAHTTETIEYFDLGTPQEFEAPEDAKKSDPDAG